MLTEAAKRVREGTMAPARLLALEKAIGFNHNPVGLLADVDLRKWVRIGEVASFDWMHSALQDGTLTTEMFLFPPSILSIGIRHGHIKDYLEADWLFPHAFGGKRHQLWRIFDDHRARSSETAERLKVLASDLLGLHGICRHWVSTDVPIVPALADARASSDAVCHVVDLFLQAKRGVESIRDVSVALLAALSRHLELHVKAYGRDHVKPKHHWMFDCAQQLGGRGMVLDAFVIERLHLRVKRQAEVVCNLSIFESAVLCGVLNEQFRDCTTPLTNRLAGHTTSTPTFHHASVGKRMVIGNLRIGSGDIIYRHNVAGWWSVAPKRMASCML